MAHWGKYQWLPPCQISPFQRTMSIFSVPAWGWCSASALGTPFSVPSSKPIQFPIHSFQAAANCEYFSSPWLSPLHFVMEIPALFWAACPVRPAAALCLTHPLLPRDVTWIITDLCYSSPHMAPSYTINFILFRPLRSLIWYFNPPLCRWLVPTPVPPPNFHSILSLFPSRTPLIPFSHLYFLFPSIYFGLPNPSPWLQPWAVTFWNPLCRFEREILCSMAGSFPGFSRHFQDVHVSSAWGYYYSVFPTILNGRNGREKSLNKCSGFVFIFLQCTFAGYNHF